MKLVTICLLAVAVLSMQATCRNSQKAPTAGCYKGRLEVKGMCMNYTIAVLEGSLDTSLVESNWRDEHSGKIHRNVFGLGSPCTFPARIKEGEEFYFTIDSSATKNCAVCMAYYPTPAKKLAIRILSAPCNP
ncbi:MAG: hypothetical protein EOO15_21155 [Chitinophagaceae bacterium]|nr:MAG: hypothetical protein EOO15_21155 [Chitinophagaceae bacterium]